MTTHSVPRHPDLEQIRMAQQHGNPDRALCLIEALPEDDRTHPWTLILEGICLFATGRSKTASGLIIRAAQEVPAPEISGWASDLGLGFLNLGRADKAEALFLRAVEFPSPDSAAFNRLGAICVASDRLEQARDAFARALELEPDRPEIISNLGGVAARLGNPGDALAYYERALNISPGLHVAESGRQAMLVELERADEVIADVENKIAALDEADHEAKLRLNARLAGLLDAAGRVDESLAILRRQARSEPEDAASLAPLALSLLKNGRFFMALAAFRHLCELEPDNHAHRATYTSLLADTGQVQEAMRQAERLKEQAGGMPVARLAIAQALDASGGIDEAEAQLKSLVNDAPGLAQAWLRLGHLHLVHGHMEEAVKELEQAATLDPSALANLVEAKHIPEDEQTLSRMARFASNSLLPRESRAAMLFAIAKVYDRLGDYESAFINLYEANRLVAVTLKHDPGTYSGRIREIIQATPREFFSRTEGMGHHDKSPIFITGMPRSGTSLTEQILAGHEHVHGAGELGYLPRIAATLPRALKSNLNYPQCLQSLVPEIALRAGRHYVSKTKSLSPGHRRIVDKLPHNFMHLGLIQAILPGASLVHIKRDLRDIAMSTFFVNFKYRQGLSYAFDLAHIGRALADHEIIMNHWHEMLAERLITFSYENLAENPEPTVRRLFESLGLDYTPRALEFHREKRTVRTASAGQVRSPVHSSSVGRWKNYTPWLDPLFTELDRAGLV